MSRGSKEKVCSITLQLEQIVVSSVCLEEEPHQWTQKIFLRLDMLRAEGADGRDNFLERKVSQSLVKRINDNN